MSACPAGDNRVTSWILIACWVLFAVVWLAGSIYNGLRSGRIERRGPNGWWWLLLAGAFALAIAPRTLWRPIIVCESWMQWTGAILLLAGTIFTLWARATLGTMWSSMPGRRAGHELRTNGPYRVTRHPIYTGLLTMLLGTTLLNGIGVWAPMFVFIVIGLNAKLRIEERLMREAFGEAYLTYQTHVPGLLPWPRPR